MSRRAARAVHPLPDRLRGGHEAPGYHLGESDRRRAGLGGLGEVACEVVGERAAVATEACQECRLRLPDDLTRDAHHHVVEAPVLEVVLDPRAGRSSNGAVHDVGPGIRSADLVLAPVEPAIAGIQAVPVEREHIVDNYLQRRRRRARTSSRPRRRASSRSGPGSHAPRPRRRACPRAVPPSPSRPRPPASRTSGCAPTSAQPRRRRRCAGRRSSPRPTARRWQRSTRRTRAPRRPTPSRAANASVAASAPDEVTAPRDGGQLPDAG